MEQQNSAWYSWSAQNYLETWDTDTDQLLAQWYISDGSGSWTVTSNSADGTSTTATGPDSSQMPASGGFALSSGSGSISVDGSSGQFDDDLGFSYFVTMNGDPNNPQIVLQSPQADGTVITIVIPVSKDFKCKWEATADTLAILGINVALAAATYGCDKVGVASQALCKILGLGAFATAGLEVTDAFSSRTRSFCGG